MLCLAWHYSNMVREEHLLETDAYKQNNSRRGTTALMEDIRQLHSRLNLHHLPQPILGRSPFSFHVALAASAINYLLLSMQWTRVWPRTRGWGLVHKHQICLILSLSLSPCLIKLYAAHFLHCLQRERDQLVDFKEVATRSLQDTAVSESTVSGLRHLTSLSS